MGLDRPPAGRDLLVNSRAQSNTQSRAQVQLDYYAFLRDKPMDLPRDHYGKTELDPYRGFLSAQLRIPPGARSSTFGGWRSWSERTPEGDQQKLPTQAGTAVTSIALALLFVSLLGTSSTVFLYCLIVGFGIGWRIRHAGLLLVATVAVTMNTFVLPPALMFSSSGTLKWTLLPIWCFEGLLINWLLIQLYKDLNDPSSSVDLPLSTSGLSPAEESTLHLLIESSSQSQERLRLMVESIGEYAIVMLTPEGSVASWNVGAERILGYRAEEILGRNHTVFYVPEDIDLRVPDRHIEMSKTNGTFEAEGWRRRKDDSRLWAHVGVSPMRSSSGNLLGFAVVIRDMTKKRQAEESLHQAYDDMEARVRDRTAELAAANDALHKEVDERIQAQGVLQQQSLVLRSILDSIADAVIVDEGDGKPLTFNAAARALFGIGHDSLTLTQWLELEILQTVNPEKTPATISMCRKPLTLGLHGQQVDDLELIVRSPGSERVRWLLANARALQHPIGGSKGAVVAFRDITERRGYAEELRAAKEAAEAASRAKDQFLAILSHELRTPLTPILLATSDLLEQDDLRAEFRSTLAMIHRNAKLEARLIDDLLDITRATTGRLTLLLASVDVHRVIQHAAEVCRAEITDSQLVLNLQLSASEHYVSGDPARLQQVFWNLIKNAAKFTPPGGSITIRTWNSSGPEAADIQLLAAVSDTGIGIHADRLPRIFSAFEQKAHEQQRRYGGLGLGLAISRSVIEAHGGRLTATSAGENRGATLTVEFIALSDPNPNIITIDGPRASLKGSSLAQGLTILLIDDNRDTLNYLASLLQQRGHQVIPAHTLRTATKLVEVNTYDLVISDIELPDGSGLDLMRDLTSRRPTPGIALSGFGTGDDVAMSLQAGFAEHLTKPIDFAKLEESIRRVVKTRALDHRELKKEPPLLQVTAMKPRYAGEDSSSGTPDSLRHNGNFPQGIRR
jgi:PAS domain S-box-containing protein